MYLILLGSLGSQCNVGSISSKVLEMVNFTGQLA